MSTHNIVHFRDEDGVQARVAILGENMKFDEFFDQVEHDAEGGMLGVGFNNPHRLAAQFVVFHALDYQAGLRRLGAADRCGKGPLEFGSVYIFSGPNFGAQVEHTVHCLNHERPRVTTRARR